MPPTEAPPAGPVAGTESIRTPALYWATYARMFDLIRHVGVWRPPVGTRVLRAARDTRCGRRLSVEECRTPHRSATTDNRWTGPRPAPLMTGGTAGPADEPPPTVAARIADILARPGDKPPATGVYTALDLNDALLGEVTWYAVPDRDRRVSFDNSVRRRLAGKTSPLDAPTFHAALAATEIVEFEVAGGVTFADLSMASDAGQALVRGLWEDLDGSVQRGGGAAEAARIAAVRAALGAAGFESPVHAYRAQRNYSVARAMGQAIRDLFPKCGGIRVTSARSEAGLGFGEATGDNLVFFGSDREPVRALVPHRMTTFERRTGGRIESRVSPAAPAGRGGSVE